ncbi:hypothetical protein [Methylomonas koyamae]|uniref:Uncharacterized protein n=1 Tax=Methylomonas koyamae TaxID=702114 RepID=A0AA91DBB8_9GAMM|nr:hypothetical protein [Methylomonas koyamae]OAI24975.1 hypothetical protein A1356_14455 [Methylomonas koyamae]WNB75746.1 hypothetical protein RI210_21120 [Methylomonas koyamae]
MFEFGLAVVLDAGPRLIRQITYRLRDFTQFDCLRPVKPRVISGKLRWHVSFISSIALAPDRGYYAGISAFVIPISLRGFK